MKLITKLLTIACAMTFMGFVQASMLVRTANALARVATRMAPKTVQKATASRSTIAASRAVHTITPKVNTQRALIEKVRTSYSDNNQQTHKMHFLKTRFALLAGTALIVADQAKAEEKNEKTNQAQKNNDTAAQKTKNLDLTDLIAPQILKDVQQSPSSSNYVRYYLAPNDYNGYENISLIAYIIDQSDWHAERWIDDKTFYRLKPSPDGVNMYLYIKAPKDTLPNALTKQIMKKIEFKEKEKTYNNNGDDCSSVFCTQYKDGWFFPTEGHVIEININITKAMALEYLKS